jgi:hypothetical protein
MSVDMIQEYEAIDNMRMRCIAKADKYCRKMYMGGILFSPQVNIARRQIEFWHLVTKKILGLKVSSQLIHRTAKKAKLGWMLLRDISLEMAESKENVAYHHYKGLHRKDGELRGTFLEDLVEAKAVVGDMAKELILKQLKNREANRLSN